MISNKYFNTSNWTGRTPRTMHEAFGCSYHSFGSQVPNMGSFRHFVIYVAVLSIALFLVSLISGVTKLW